ncbi:MAG: DNA polymerase III subunit chi [Betaproteobacteria bacterium]|nr:DNA polymerase III subunit chi [Betaproteobacteria bacterium]
MIEVEFHTGVTDSVGFTCRLLRKACRQGARVLVTAPEPTLRELDRALWTFWELEFVPHVRMPGAAAGVAARTPVWLAGDTSTAGAPAVVVNLGADAPIEVGDLQRLIEVVSADPDDAARGRERWRAYKAAGLQIRHHAAGPAGD